MELLGRDGSPRGDIAVDTDHAASLLDKATTRARDAGIGWEDGEIRLVPAPKLIELIRRSRKHSAE